MRLTKAELRAARDLRLKDAKTLSCTLHNRIPEGGYDAECLFGGLEDDARALLVAVRRARALNKKCY